MTEHSIKVYRFGDVGNPDEPNDAARSGNPDSKINGGSPEATARAPAGLADAELSELPDVLRRAPSTTWSQRPLSVA